MIQFSNTRIDASSEEVVVAGSVIPAVGRGLVQVAAGVRLPTGATPEAFTGFSIGVNQNVSDMPVVSSLVSTTPASAALSTITLPSTPLAGTLRVVAVLDNVEQTAGTPSTGAASNKYSLSGQVLSLDYARAGQTFLITYRTAITAVQSRALQGNEPAGGVPGSLLGTVGVMRRGVLATYEFDTTVDWANIDPATVCIVKGTGMLSTAAAAGANAGPIVPRFQLKAVPTSGGYSNAILTFYFAA